MKEEKIMDKINKNLKIIDSLLMENGFYKYISKIVNIENGVSELYDNYKELEEENKSLQSQLKAKEEVIKEAREVISKMISIGYIVENGATAIQYIPTGKKTEFYPRAKIIDEILSKGENK